MSERASKCDKRPQASIFARAKRVATSDRGKHLGPGYFKEHPAENKLCALSAARAQTPSKCNIKASSDT